MRRLHGLDALRGIAAMVVAFHHLSIIYGGPGLGVLPQLAVDLFFVLSGFVIARTYEDRMRGGLTTLKFVGLRYRRLFLPLAIGTTLGLIWRLPAGAPIAGLVAPFVLALGFIPAFWLGNAFMFNVPAWSLFLEIIANAIHGSIFGKLSDGALTVALAIAGSVAAALMFAGYGHWEYDVTAILSCLPRELTFYLAGILAFRRFGDGAFAFGGEWALWLGALSYPLYATHVPVLHLAAMVGASPALALMIAFAFAALLAVTIEKWRPRSPVIGTFTPTSAPPSPSPR